MNELLGWYGYSNVDRNDLSKSSKINIADSQKSNVNILMVPNAQKRRRRGSGADGFSNTVIASSRTTTSTPDRCGNSSSPDSHCHSYSPSASKNIEKQGWN